MKKYIIGGAFLIGGIFIIKKILPDFSLDKITESEKVNIDDVIEKERIKEANERAKRERLLALQELPKLSRAGGMFTTIPLSAIPITY